MYREEEISNIINDLKKFESKEISYGQFIEKVCDFFDLIKNDDLSWSDKNFLLYLSNKVGIPHYYDMLYGFKNKNLGINDICLNTFSSLLYESTLFTDSHTKLHKYQKEVLDKFKKDKANRYFLSASTSFGKTFLVYEIIKKMKYKNVVLIFPTIALLSENLERLRAGDIKDDFNEYKIHTLSEFTDNDKIEDKNLFIFTPERFLSFLDKNIQKIKFDFIFVDEAYKMDNEYLIEDEQKENERDLAYRLAIYFGLFSSSRVDALLAGPYINFDESVVNNSFNLFLRDYEFEVVDMNKCEIVSKKMYPLDTLKHIEKSGLNIKENFVKFHKLKIVLEKILEQKENVIIYCYRKASVERNALKFIKESKLKKCNSSNEELNIFIKHLKSKYDSRWIVIKSLEYGIGIHHGSVPKYIQKEIIKLFNSGSLKMVFATTTITEGVNTSAKNILVFDSQKGDKELKPFDAKNIVGRAGRFFYHYSGNVFYLESKFNEILSSECDIINHKNYDKDSRKDDIDIDITKEEYLTKEEKERKEEVKKEAEKLEIPEEILEKFKVISRRDKLFIYREICAFSEERHRAIRSLISRVNMPNLGIDYDGFQLVLETIYPKIKDKQLKAGVKGKFTSKRSGLFREYSVITHQVNEYLTKGFFSLYKYELERKIEKSGNNLDLKINACMRSVSGLIFNTFRYQLVKYLGVFNVMYKFERSKKLNKNFDNIHGIDKLLSKLEYNALTQEGRIVSDYGVTESIIKYYDSSIQQRKYVELDPFEQELLERVKKVI